MSKKKPSFRRELPTIVQAFIDDTGAERPDGIFRWVGLFATSKVWATFGEKWCEILNREPGIYYWHTVSAHNGKMPIPREAREAKEMALAELIGSYSEAVVSVEVEISMEEYRRVTQELLPVGSIEEIAPGMMGAMRDPVFIALRALMTMCILIGAQWKKDSKELGQLLVWSVFEDRDAEWQDDVCFALRVLKRVIPEEQRKVVGPVVFLPGKGRGGALPIEAADLFAWHVNRLAQNPDDEQPGWEHLSRIKRNRRRVTTEIMESMVRSLNDTGEAPLI